MKNQTSEAVDVKKIMEEIKEEIRERGLINDIPPFSSITPLSVHASNYDSRIQNEIRYINTIQIHYDRELISCHRMFKRIVIFGKRIIRKLCRFIGVPIVDEINAYHQHMAKAISYIDGYIRREEERGKEAKEKEILGRREYYKQIEQYIKTVNSLEKKVEELNRKISIIETQEKEQECLRLKLDILQLQLEKERMQGNKVRN